MPAPATNNARAAAALALLRKRTNTAEALAARGCRIDPNTTFLEWVEELGANGLLVDGHPFDLESRPALREIYEAVPNTKAAGYNRMFAIMKGAQTGATVMTFLLQLFMCLKYEPLKVGTYYPHAKLATYVSNSRFMPVVRSVPVAYQALREVNKGTEGNVLNRMLGSSEVLFLWTSGSSVTESFPLGAIVADEVQNMTDEEIERIRERMSASDVRFFFACSTAKWPGADIDLLYSKGDQRRFHTNCRCDDGVILDDTFPECVQFNAGEWDAYGAPRDYVYTCPSCRAYIPNSQSGRWVKHNPESPHVSYHLPQTLSPTVSPREIIESYLTAVDMSNFFQRKLGKPWTDPSQVPITLAICERQVEAGRRLGVQWKQTAKGTFMGLDQMGGFIVAIVLEKLASGHMAVIHTEFIYGGETWSRCDELMTQFGVQTCVLEQLPNIDSARDFANRFPGRVWLGTYGGDQAEMMNWSDQMDRSKRRTIEDDRSRWRVGIQQYKAMQTALFRISKGECVFPEPNEKAQDILNKGVMERKAVLREVFDHLTRVALVVEHDEETRRPKTFVKKVGTSDPHAAYAFMLANIAWARAWGTGQILAMDQNEGPITDVAQKLLEVAPNVPAKVLEVMDSVHGKTDTCASCRFFIPERSWCKDRSMGTEASAPKCIGFERRKG
jgi:hypothetical protein